jgi:hypothetical protein
MEIETKSKNERLNAMVAITVVIISVFMEVSKVKDGNIVQAMALAKADAVDNWNEYQANRIKLHMDEDLALELKLNPAGEAAAATLAGKMDHYNKKSPELMAKARAAEARYDALDDRHKQFDAMDALLSVALALTAVAALTDIFWMIVVGWSFAGLGFLMGAAGYLALPFHLDLFGLLS